MTKSHYQSIEEPRQKVVMSEDEIVEARRSNNLEVLGKIKESKKAEEMFQITKDEVAKGWLEFARPLEEQDLHEYSLARRLAMVEFRQLEERGWRLRLVDHFTENLCNAGAWSKRKLQSDGLDTQKEVAFYMMRRGKKVKQSKGDVSSAFRRVPVRSSQRQYLAIAFMVQSVMMLAVRNSAPLWGDCSRLGLA